MIQLAVVAALAATFGGVVEVSARDSRYVALGVSLTMVAAPLASSPEPPNQMIAFRFLGALLAGYLLWAAARDRSISSDGSGVGPTAEIATAAAAFCVGWYVVVVKPLAGPQAAQAAGIGLAALAIMPLAGRNVMRAGAGLAVLMVGITLLLQAWIGPATALQQVAFTALLVGVVGATSALMSPTEVQSDGDEAALDSRAYLEQAPATDEPPIEAVPPPDARPARRPVAGARRATPPAIVTAPAHPSAAVEAAPAPPAGSARLARSPRAARRAMPAANLVAPNSDEEAAAVDQPPITPAATPAPTRARTSHPRDPRR